MPAFLSRFLRGDAAYHAAVDAAYEGRRLSALVTLLDIVYTLERFELTGEQNKAHWIKTVDADTARRKQRYLSQLSLDDFEKAYINETLATLEV
jgi:hypothetical protein